jgi:nitroreductase
VASAISAPSVLNTQPWSFIIRDNRVELHADKDRQLQVLDPHGRQLLMSCGAALLNLRLAIVQRTLDPEVRLLPEATDPLHVATVRIGRTRTPRPDEASSSRPYRDGGRIAARFRPSHHPPMP